MLKYSHEYNEKNKKSGMRYEWWYGLNACRLHDETTRV